MGTIKTTIQSLFTSGGSAIPPSTNDMAIGLQVARLYGFLPPPITIEFDAESVIISYPEEPENDKAKAERLAERAAVHAVEGRCEQAIKLWQRALEFQPTRIATWRDLGMAYFELRRISEAKHHFVTALRLDPADADSLVGLAHLADHQGDWVQGERFARQALNIDPRNAWALNVLGAILAATDRTPRAAELFLNAIEANPKFATGYLNLASIRIIQGRHDEAMEHLQQLFIHAEQQDVRDLPVFERARSLFGMLKSKLAARSN